MPELPDLENFKQYFKSTSLHQEIKEVKNTGSDLIDGVNSNELNKELSGRKFEDAYRRGKFLVVELEESSKKVVFHFGMTGSLEYEKVNEIDSSLGKDNAKVSFLFNNGYVLHWLNPRKLGKVYLVDEAENVELLDEMGPEPLELSEHELLALLEEHSNKNIKSFFMDQRDIAGIGNIFSDEILFRTGIIPHRNIKELDLDTRKKMHKNMIEVLKEAIEVGPPDGDFDSSWLTAHRNEDMICPNNDSHNLLKETVAGRSAIYCPVCQK